MDGTSATTPGYGRGDRASGKRSLLEGGALSEEALDSSTSVYEARGPRARAGLQQFFSPPEAATLAYQVIAGQGCAGHFAPYVLDPTAGNGALLAGWPADRRFGVEIDRDQVEAGQYTAVRGDLQRLYPLLRLSGARFPAVACNPPFGLDWRDPASGKAVNSTALCLRFALGLLADHGQGLLIAGRDRYHRVIEPLNEADGVWATVDCPDLFEDTELGCTLAFFVSPANRREGEVLRLEAERRELVELAEEIRNWRQRTCGHVATVSMGGDEPLREAFAAVQREHDGRLAVERGRRSRYDLQLHGDQIACHPSGFAKLALSECRLLRQVQQLDGKSVQYFGLNLREWRTVEQAAASGALTIAPDVAGRVAEVSARAAREATPLYPLKPQMRLGYLADLERIHCVKDDPARGFLCGEDYPLATRTKVHTEKGEKLVETRTGEQELRRFQRERKLLELTIGREHFDESPESIGYVLEYFELPDPGDLAGRYPQEVARAKAVLQEIADEHGFMWKSFQLEDLSRLAVKGSGVLAHEQGLGKTVQQMGLAEAMPRLYGAQDCALFVVPQDLIPQWQREATKFFGRTLEVIDGPAKAHAVARRLRADGRGWFVTYYEALSLTGRKDERLPEQVLEWSEPDEHGEREPLLTSADACPACRADGWAGWQGTACRGCGYVHKRLAVRNAASHLAGAFRRGVVCVDELSLIRGDDSLRSKAIRALRARHRFGATGTPISNYVNDAFWGLWWTLGNASERFPYDYQGKAKFEADFCVVEHTMGHKEGEEHQRKRRKVLPEVTNLSLLWRLLSASMVRRRKEDTGEKLAERVFHPVRVPFGERQRELHQKWLKDFTSFFCQTHPDSPLVKAGVGVVELFAAGLGQLPKLEYAATLPAADPDLAWTTIEASNWTPKTLKVLELCLERVRAGDKVLIGSCLIETGRFLAERLGERGVEALHIVEEREGRAQTKNPRKRAAELQAFIEGDAQVLCAGVNAVKLGHNLDTASTVILDGLPWSHEALDQFLARVHRLTSKRAVSVYVALTRGSVDERKWDLLTRKGQAADLALDGQLVSEPEQPVDWNTVLRQMRAAGVAANGEELSERDLEVLWQRAEGAYRPLEGSHPVAVLADRLVVDRHQPDASEQAPEDDGGQLSFDLAA